MHFEKETVGPERLGRMRHGGHEFAVAARLAARRARALHRVGAVHHDRRGDFEHVGDIAEIDDEVVVAERVAALGQPDVTGPRLAGLFVGVAHVRARKELGLFDIHRFAGPGCGDHQIGLAAEERRNLDHVDDLADGCGLPRFVDVGEQTQSPLRPHVRKHLQPLFESRAAERRYGSAVGLVERGLEDDFRAEGAVDGRKPFAHGVQQFGRFNDARTCDKFYCHKIRIKN